MRKCALNLCEQQRGDQSVHPCCLMHAFVVRFLDCSIPALAKSKIVVCVTVQTGLSLK